MTVEAALAEIEKLWKEYEAFPFGLSDNSKHVKRLETEFGNMLPESLQDYVKNFAPAKDFYFDTVGNPMRIYSIENLKHRQDGYNFNPVKNVVIENWEDSFFIFADEGADPVIFGIKNPEKGIQKLIHGLGSWDNGEIIAETFGQFLLCTAAQHHALNHFEIEVIIDNDKGFNLADGAAKWYFPNMKKWAGNYYEEWCSVFNNH